MWDVSWCERADHLTSPLVMTVCKGFIIAFALQCIAVMAIIMQKEQNLQAPLPNPPNKGTAISPLVKTQGLPGPTSVNAAESHVQKISHLKVGLIGDPVAHSFSPRLQQAAFDALHISARYELWHTTQQELVARVRALCNKDALGANVTVPHKEAVIPLLDMVDPLAARIGSVNTIVHRDDYLYGYNTDAPGLLNALAEHGLGERDADGQICLKDYTAILLGAGRLARSVAFALASAGVARLIILNQHLEPAQLLAAEVQQCYDGPVFSLSDPTFLIPLPSSIIINAT